MTSEEPLLRLLTVVILLEMVLAFLFMVRGPFLDWRGRKERAKELARLEAEGEVQVSGFRSRELLKTLTALRREVKTKPYPPDRSGSH
jgi:hypothetical protein